MRPVETCIIDSFQHLGIEKDAAPDLTFEDLRRSLRGGEFRDPLRKFSDACREEFRALRA
jgi:hypothetical protein